MALPTNRVIELTISPTGVQGAFIDDAVVSPNTTWSSTQITAVVDAHVESSDPHPNITSVTDHAAIAAQQLA